MDGTIALRHYGLRDVQLQVWLAAGLLLLLLVAVGYEQGGLLRLAMGQVEAVLDHLAEPACGAQTAHVRVWPQFAVTNSDKKTSRPVSMSWWLSTPIQIHLHQQTELRRTVNRNNDEMGKIWSALDKPPGCVGRPVVPSTVEIQRRMKGP